MIRTLILPILMFLAAPAWADCEGRDLFASLPDEDRAWITARAHAQPFPEGKLWVARRDDQVVHLLGSMHFHEPRHQPTLDRVKPLIDSAQLVFLEATKEDEARLKARIAENPDIAFYVSGPTLPDRLPDPLWQKLRSALADRGTPGFMTAKMRPWMALVSLSMSKCVVQDVMAGRRGLDQMVGDHAAAKGVPVMALEPFDTALKLFDSYTEEEMIEFLRLTLSLENFDPDDQYRTLVESYFRGEIRAIWEFTVLQSLKQPQGMSETRIFAEYARMEEAMVGLRNRQWMDRILPAAADGPVFVAAGALHLPGDKGLLAMLHSEGFSIERLD